MSNIDIEGFCKIQNHHNMWCHEYFYSKEKCPLASRDS